MPHIPDPIWMATSVHLTSSHAATDFAGAGTPIPVRQQNRTAAALIKPAYSNIPQPWPWPAPPRTLLIQAYPIYSVIR